MSQETKPKGRSPAFQFYADDFLAGTITMTNEEKGAYISLLCIQWSRGFLTENDFQRVCAGMPTHSSGICQGKFQVDAEGNYRNKRLEAERTKQREYSEKQREIANRRWKVDANALPTHMPDDAKAMPTHMPESCSPSPSPSPKEKTKTSPKSEWDVGYGIELPEAFRTQNCLAAVKLWLQHKAEKRESYKKTGLTAALTKWSNEFSASEFPSIVDHSIASGWSGIFRPRNIQQPSNGRPSSNPTDAMDIRNYL